VNTRKATSGISRNGLPFVRIGGGARCLVIFEGLNFQHKQASRIVAQFTGHMFMPFTRHFTVYNVGRRPGLPRGYSILDMSDDYAEMIKNEFSGTVDVMGISTGGPIALQFAVDHPQLVRRLVLASTGYRLSETGVSIQQKLIDLTRRGEWRSAAVALAGGMVSGVIGKLTVPFFWMLGRTMFGSPETASDGLVELEAEDRFDFTDRMAEVKMPTLVIGGERDAFYPIRETAAGIPSARLVLYRNTGHMAMMKRRFKEDVLRFLTLDEEGGPTSAGRFHNSSRH
jgi:pimeloyl-ACP methyl ester carboxylesterase